MRFTKSLLLLSALSLLLLLPACGKKESPRQPQQAQQGVEALKPPHIVEDKEEGSLVAKIPSGAKAEDAPEIKSDDSNVIIDTVALNARKEPLPAAKAPEGCLASKFAVGENKISWRPSWHFKGLGGAWLKDMKISSDASLLAVVETTGADEGPFGSRIILWNAYTWDIVKVLEVDRKISSIEFIPGRAVLLALCERQNDLKQPFALVKLDLEAGALADSLITLKDSVTSLVCVSGTAAFLTCAGDENIIGFNPNTLNAPVKRRSCANKGGILAVSLDKQTLLCTGKSGTELFIVSGTQLTPKSDVMLPDAMQEAGAALFVDVNAFVLAPVVKPGEDCDSYLVRDSTTRSILKGGVPLFALDAKGKRLFAGGKIKSVMHILGLPGLEETSSFCPPDLSPKTAGVTLRIDWLEPLDALAALDSKGNGMLFKFSAKDKHWRKYVLFTPKKD